MLHKKYMNGIQTGFHLIILETKTYQSKSKLLKATKPALNKLKLNIYLTMKSKRYQN